MTQRGKKTFNKNHRANQRLRQADRWHKCQRCGQVYGCDPCSEALTKSVRRVGRNSGVSLYRGTGPIHAFLCDTCRKQRRPA